MSEIKHTLIAYIYCIVAYATVFNLSACAQSSNLINESGTTLQTRIKPPEGFARENSDKDSFTTYLRNLPLKPHGCDVKYYNGTSKGKHHVYIAVVDMEIGDKNLQQCADAVIRLRAEYLYSQKKYNDITFNFTSGFKASYSEWMKGKRISLKGNTATWKQLAKESNTYADFRKYLDIVFTYAGTLSLSKELNTKKIENIKPGDVFIQGGSPGHAVIVIDVVINNTGKKMFLLAQSYMPAQDIQILKNPKNENLWYDANFSNTLITPEWIFNKTDLKEFKD